MDEFVIKIVIANFALCIRGLVKSKFILLLCNLFYHILIIVKVSPATHK